MLCAGGVLIAFSIRAHVIRFQFSAGEFGKRHPLFSCSVIVHVSLFFRILPCFPPQPFCYSHSTAVEKRS